MDVNDDDHQELEALETLSLTDFPLTTDNNSIVQDYHNHHQTPPSPSTEDAFEFCSGGSNRFYEQHMMYDAEDMIYGGKLMPTNSKQAQRARCESMRELKSTTNKGTIESPKLFRNSYSFDSKKLTKNMKVYYEPTTDNNSRNSLCTKTSSSRWTELMFGPLKGPPEMDLRDIRNRQSVQNSSKSLFPAVEGERFPVNRVGDNRKTSWRVLRFLSCKKSGSVAVTMPLS